jgi:Ran GTPase-activating protein (RanGAP) involved in mRNA processing and transport
LISRTEQSHLVNNNVAAVRCIADGFRTNTTLQVLELSSCKLGDQGILILAESLGQRKRGLVDLDLSVNHSTYGGLRALVDNDTVALSTLTHLDLSLFSLIDEGATFLAETLRVQTLLSLKGLRLICCDISDGLAAVVSALEEIKTLESVDLKDNAFSVHGYLALASGLPKYQRSTTGRLIVDAGIHSIGHADRRCWKGFKIILRSLHEVLWRVGLQSKVSTVAKLELI